MPPTAIVLIPGFFGYGTFGADPERPLLEYFGGVRAELELAGLTEDRSYFIVVHEPPPTGSLDERVASLHDLVGKLLRGDELPHDAKPKTTPPAVAAPFRAERIHLVGHSTGGVDARLFANKKYTWSGGPRGRERLDPIDKIAAIVTLSAPFYGTPITTHIQGDANLLLQAVQVLTMLGVFKNGHVDVIGIEGIKSLLEGIPGVLTNLHLHSIWAGLAALLTRRVDPGTRASPPAILNDAPGVDGFVAQQIGAFFQSIEDDRQLLGDLTVAHLEDLMARLDGGDSRPIASYVTVSPAPPRLDLGADPIGRIVYHVAYEATAHDPSPRRIPMGPTLGDEAALSKLLADGVACDGVVPARSQTIAGEAAAIVLGDHLDVVGSFQGGRGANIMRSGADFETDRFRTLWQDVARRLA